MRRSTRPLSSPALSAALEDGIPALATLAQGLGTKTLPESPTEYLAPLQRLLLYATTENGRATVKGFLEIK